MGTRSKKQSKFGSKAGGSAVEATADTIAARRLHGVVRVLIDNESLFIPRIGTNDANKRAKTNNKPSGDAQKKYAVFSYPPFIFLFYFFACFPLFFI